MNRDERGIEDVTGELLRVFETGEVPEEWEGRRIEYLAYGLGYMVGKLLALSGRTGELVECLKSVEDGAHAAISTSVQ
jgi:hypothetical protein